MLNPLLIYPGINLYLFFSELEAVLYNINRKNADLKLFRFVKLCVLAGYEEKKHLSLFLTGNRNQENITETVGFFLFQKDLFLRILFRLEFEKAVFRASDVFFLKGFFD
jgi:phenylalanyl-tRNA synthetase beta chain